MYNTLFGINNAAPYCLLFIGVIDVRSIERFRDAIIIKRRNKYYVEILTRTGGDNKKSYPNNCLLLNKLFVNRYDDKYDNTYAHFIFRIPSGIKKKLVEMIYNTQSRKSLDLRTMFENELKQMEIPGTDAYKRAKQMARGVQRLAEKSDSNFEIITPDYLMKLGEEEDGE